MSTDDLIPELVSPAVAQAEYSDIQFNSKSFRQKSHNARLHCKFKGISLAIGSYDILPSCIERLSLLIGPSEKKIGHHGNSFGIAKRNICPIDSMRTVLVLNLIAIPGTHGNLRDGKISRCEIKHAAVIRKPKTYSHIVLEHIHELRICGDHISGRIYSTDDQQIEVVIDMLGIACRSTEHPCTLLQKRR